MSKDIQQTAQAAARAQKDAEFKKEILEAKEEFPEVRDAILADLAEAEQAQQTSAHGAGGKRLQYLIDRAKPW